MLLDWVCCTRLIRTLITVCSASFHLFLLEFDIPELRSQLFHWSLKYQGVERHNLQGVSCRQRFECGMTYSTVFDTGMLNGFKGAVNRWLLASLVFPSFFSGAGACGVAKSTYEQLVFPTWPVQLVLIIIIIIIIIIILQLRIQITNFLTKIIGRLW